MSVATFARSPQAQMPSVLCPLVRHTWTLLRLAVGDVFGESAQDFVGTLPSASV